MNLTPINPNFNACDQQWELMPPKDNGRYCESCERTLIDFSAMTTAEMLSKQKANGFKLCGKYTDDQVEVLHLHLQHRKSPSRLPWLVALAMGTASLLPLNLAAQDSLSLDIPLVNVSIPGATAQVPLLKNQQHKIVIQGKVTEKNTGDAVPRPKITIQGLTKEYYGAKDGTFRIELTEEDIALLPRHAKINIWGNRFYNYTNVHLKWDKKNQPKVINAKLTRKKRIVYHTGVPYGVI